MIRRPVATWWGGLGAIALVAAVVVSACDGVDNSEIYTEPIIVHGAQFFPGELPGAPMPSADASAPAPVNPNLAVTAITALNTTIFAGEAGWQISGDATSTASAVGIRLGNLGTGYWLLPLGNPDPVLANQLTFGALLDFNPNVTPGIQPLRIVAVTPNGEYSVQNDQNLCVAARLPADPGAPFSSDITACNKSVVPPEAVFSLTWDADVDLDLHVITPAGLDVNAKAPLVDPIDAGAVPSKSDARIDRDSIAFCAPDGWREEDLVFPVRPAPGSIFQIKANLFSACGLPSVTFALTTYESTGTAGAGAHLVQTYKTVGTLNAIDADGDASGLLIASYPF